MNIDKLRRTLQRYRDRYNYEHDLPRELISHLALRKNAIVMRVTAPSEKEPLRPEIYLRRNVREINFYKELIKENYKLVIVDGFFTPRRLGRKGVIFELTVLLDQELQTGSSKHEQLEADSCSAAGINIRKLSKRIPDSTAVYIFDSRFSLLVFDGFYSQYELDVMRQKRWRGKNAELLSEIMKRSVEEMGYGKRLKTISPSFSFDTNRGFVLVEFKRPDATE